MSNTTLIDTIICAASEAWRHDGEVLATGIGIVLDTGLVRGGGFLGVRAGGYGGALQLRLGPVEVKAVGLLTLEPSFGLVVVMSIEFLPPIDLPPR